MLIIFFLLFICFLNFVKICFLHKYFKYVILPGVSYGTSTSFRLQKETSCL